MTLDEIRAHAGEGLTLVRKMVEASLESDIELLNSTNKTILSHASKGLRPLLSLLIAHACAGRANEDSIRFATAVELLHNATLLHDDVADGSPERRGHPSVATMVGAPASVLIGDFWLVKAVDRVLDSQIGYELIRQFAKTLSDLAQGEMLQLQKAVTADTDEQDYLKIIYCKTASLFETSAIAGAMSVNASKEQISAGCEYARNLGIAFQIKDDIFDYSAGEEIGKPVGIDLKEQKITLPLLGALASVSEQEQAEIRSKVRDIADNESNIADVRDFVLAHDGVAYATRHLQEYIDKAKDALDIFPDAEPRRCLCALADYVSERKV